MDIDFRSLPGGKDLSRVFCNKAVEVRQLEVEETHEAYAVIALCGRVREHEGICVVLPDDTQISGDEVAAAFAVELALEGLQ